MSQSSSTAERPVTHRFKVGDVVTTTRSVRPVDNLGNREGWATPGWKWRITALVLVAVGKGHRPGYDVVAETAPTMYSQTIRDSLVAAKVGNA